MKWISLALYLVVGLPVLVWALPKSHSPFFPNEDYTLSLDICSTSRSVTNVHPPEGTVAFSSTEGVKLTLTMVDSHYVVQIYNDSEPVSEAVDVDVRATMPNDVGDDGICADLNHDGKVDFVVTLWGHGNGLGAQAYDRLIALSSRDGYRVWVMPTSTPSAEDFVTFGQLEPIVMVTTDYANIRLNPNKLFPPPDNWHSYYVYNLWTFREGNIVTANNIDERFPKWVLMTFKENHKPARSVSENARIEFFKSGDQPKEILYREPGTH